ncbi:TspO protein [Flavivirga aquatica]|uniref:TspO protein n=1 Tax=Flavivirga aquatica TaxID=1849968 RepID=A0A1E5SHF2_9FLAO|nr:TspO/MBR family protein [Flavivirga aquatica]OEJ98542.1 TspO protein [Flavivirga aquatica]
MKILKYVILYLILNFSALIIGVFLMNDGPQTAWYTNLNKAPWTPPDWFFGVTWTSIMICFSIYMAYSHKIHPSNKVKSLFLIQFIFNIIWNYVFFNQHLIGLGFIVILLLTIIIATFLFLLQKKLKTKTILILPYLIWLCIATSLNGSILFYN